MIDLAVLLIVVSGLNPGSGTGYRALLQPLDIAPESDVYFRSIGQLGSVGNRIYLRGLENPEIVVIDRKGAVLERIGGKGQHPGEFDPGVLAMAVSEGGIWAIDSGMRWVRLLIGGRYETGFSLTGYNESLAYPTANDFAFSEWEVVLPAAAPQGYAGVVYDYKGEILRYLEREIPFDSSLPKTIRGLSDTFWLFDDDRWYCLHKYLPWVVVYDRNFEVVSRYRLRSPVLDEGFGQVLHFAPDEKMGVPKALITDAEFHRNGLFVMSGGELHQFDPKNGRLVSVTAFYGEGPDFKSVTTPNLTLFFFTILESGEIVLAHPGMLWNHDLWVAGGADRGPGL